MFLDTCTISNGACDPNAGCSHDNTTNAVECTCKTGYTNTGVAPNVVCTDTCNICNGACDPNAGCSHDNTTNAVTRAPSAMELAIQTPVAHTTTRRMQWFAHAKLVTPTLEWRPTLYAQ
ncbi:unnamed protein product, partial [Rotaria magnacalcarata]